MEWLLENKLQLAVVVGFAVLAILYIIYLCYKRGLKQVAIDFIVWAEATFESEEGQVKFDAVVTKLIAIIPMPFSLFISKSAVEKLVQNAFDSIKEALHYTPSNTINKTDVKTPSFEKGE